MEALKRVPPPYAQDHPRAELLKRKGLAASIQPGPGVSATAELVDWAEARLREAAPMITWLDRNLYRLAGSQQIRVKRSSLERSRLWTSESLPDVDERLERETTGVGSSITARGCREG